MTGNERDALRPGSDRWRGPAGFAVLLVVASVLPIPSSGTGGSGGGEIPLGLGFTDPFHLVGYAVLAALMTRVTGRMRRGLILAVVAAVAFGFGIELLQASIPWRTFAWRDVGVNAVGAVGGSIVSGLGHGSRSSGGSRD